MTSEFSDYIIYVDESGDHSLEVVYEEHPVFVLAFCISKKAIMQKLWRLQYAPLNLIFGDMTR